MRSIGVVFYLFITCFIVHSCAHRSKKDDTLDSSEVDLKIPVYKNKYDHQAMVLGTFHFNRTSDGSDVIAKNHLDIGTPEHQEQIKSLVSQIINQFKPTIVAVEFRPEFQKAFDSLYTAYKSDSWKLGKNEAFQIGFRVAKALNLPKVHCVDNRPQQPESVTTMDDWDLYAKALGQEQLWHEYDKVNDAYNTYLDEIQKETDITSYLRLLNGTPATKRNKEFWFTGLANLGVGDTYVGADLTGHWYRRNTRIFINARNLCKTRNERILVIYGQGHKWVLDEMFDGSPEFTLKQLDFFNL